MITFTTHPDYSAMHPYLKAVRDAVEGEPTIKIARTEYLKHPNPFDQTSDGAVARYEAYIAGAEFDEFPSSTERQMLGQMTKGGFVFDLPAKLEYLIENSDGDGMSLAGAIEYTYRNLLEVKSHILVAEYQGIASLDIEDVSLADIQAVNPKATIKHYTRESLIDWDFRRIDGVMQVSLMVFRETARVRDLESYLSIDVTSYLVLALDAEGYYYQQKYTQNKNGGAQAESDKVYPLISGQRLKWLPVEIVVDQEWPSGTMPKGLGFLSPVCSASIYRYQVSADYKEALRMMQPTLFSSGWKESDKELFEHLNGREYIAFGAGVSNQLPEGVTVDVVGLSVQTMPFTEYADGNSEKARALGANFDDGSAQGNVTAKQAGIDNEKATAIMSLISINTQAAFRRVIAYCGMYMGIYSPDNIELSMSDIAVDVPSRFGESKLTPQEVAEIRNNIQSAIISKDEGLRQLEVGGWTTLSADEISIELENQAPVIGVGSNVANDTGQE